MTHDIKALLERGVELAGELGLTKTAADFGYAAASMGEPSYQTRVQGWLLECFGPMIAGDREERNHRFLEEALELVQSLGCTSDEAHKLVDYVFGRSVGSPPQEVSGVTVTLAALCMANNLDMAECAETELARIIQPDMVVKIREKQKRKPAMGPPPGALPEREQTPPPPPPAVPDGYVLVEKSFVPEHVARAGEGTIRLAMQAGVTCAHTLAVAAYTDMVLAAAPEQPTPEPETIGRANLKVKSVNRLEPPEQPKAE